MYSCHIFEISQVSERKMRITLLFIFHKNHTSTSTEAYASVQGAKIVIIFLTTKRFRVFLRKKVMDVNHIQKKDCQPHQEISKNCQPKLGKDIIS